MRAARSPFAVALLALALAGCSGPGAGTAGAIPSTTAPTPSTAAAAPGSGITAEPLSTALPVQARDLRLVRVGADEVALQFEFANGTDRSISPDTLGIDQIERIMMLVGLPRGTTYEMLSAAVSTGGAGNTAVTVTTPPGGTSSPLFSLSRPVRPSALSIS